jgi:O-antigen ligase
MYSREKERWWLLLATLPILLTVVQIMSKRTAMLGVLMAATVVLMHFSRKQKKAWVASFALLTGVCFLVWTASPTLQGQFAQGLHEIREGISGQVKVESWNVRIQMIQHTLNMMIERPWLGWGIGAWNHQWALRVPEEIAGFNMPHNDFLWMGAQGGFLGGLLWLFLMTSGLGSAWKANNWSGAAASAAILVCTFSALVNNGTRDATIGLPMLWIMGVLISLALRSADVQPRFEK